MALAVQLWSVVRSQGKTMPTGGTLLIGREQDCEGGCFDSAPGEWLAPMSPPQFQGPLCLPQPFQVNSSIPTQQ